MPRFEFPPGRKATVQSAVLVLSERIDTQRKQIADLQVLVEAQRTTLNEVFLESHDNKLRLDIAEKAGPTLAPAMWANAPLHVTEDEEDAKWQLDNGMIDKKMYEEILEEAGLTPHLEIVNY